MELLDKLHSNSTKIVVHTLLGLRKTMSTSKGGIKMLRQKNVFRSLIDMLGKPNEDILDLTLSILANCSLEEESRKKIADEGAVAAIVPLLKNLSKDSIHCRVCRLIGNLAHSEPIAALLHQENVVQSLVNVVELDSTSSLPTKQMAVRALRILWQVKEQQEDMLEMNVVRKITLLLGIPQNGKQEYDLIKIVVKALAVFTENCSQKCAEQVHADGTGYPLLLGLCDKENFRKMALICLCNLCHVASCRPPLGNAGAIKILTDELSELNNKSSGIYKELVTALCLLCRESVNRAKIRRTGGLHIIHSILKNSESKSMESYVLHGLLNFVYDDLSIEELLKDGLISTLVLKLQEFVKKTGKLHKAISEHKQLKGSKRKISETNTDNEVEDFNKVTESIKPLDVDDIKRLKLNNVDNASTSNEVGASFRLQHGRCSSADQSPLCKTKYKYGSISPTHGDSWSADYFTGDWSPGSPSSMCCSPDASPPTYSPASPSSSPLSYSSQDDFCEAYSPICQETQSDDEEVIEENVEDDNCSTSSAGKCSGKEDALPNISDTETSDVLLTIGNEGPLLILLARISHMDVLSEELCYNQTVNTLLDYILLSHNPMPRAGRVLGRIVRNEHYFLSLLLQEFVLSVHFRLCRPIHDDCLFCEKNNSLGNLLLTQVTMLAESEFGVGQLERQFLVGDESVRHLMAITLPYIITARRLLSKFLLNFKALDALLELIKEESEHKAKFLKHAPYILPMLFLNLGIHWKLNKSDHPHDKCPDTACYTCTDNVELEPVTFVLDDDENFTADKALLCEHSPVFAAMFRGSFQENCQKEIKLHDVSSKSLKYIVLIMKVGKIPHCLPDLDVNEALEFLSVLDKFLIPGSEQLVDLIIRQYLSTNTVFSLYVKVVKAGNLQYFLDIRRSIVQFLLTTNVCDKERETIIRKLLHSSYGFDLLQDVVHAIHKHLGN